MPHPPANFQESHPPNHNGTVSSPSFGAWLCSFSVGCGGGGQGPAVGYAELYALAVEGVLDALSVLVG